MPRRKLFLYAPVTDLCRDSKRLAPLAAFVPDPYASTLAGIAWCFLQSESHSVSVLLLNCSTPFVVRLMLVLPLGHSSPGLDRVSYQCFTPASTKFCRMIVVQLSAYPSADSKGPNVEIDLVGFKTGIMPGVKRLPRR